ncbi:MAG: YitT family protein [Acidobacteria bacterium]|nr:YitT family protein [Acidobacteriota bacterium]MCA1620369.1 YitT family protein [Acidobacteriota bacterium]
MKRPTHAAIDVALVTLGILSAAFGLKGFLLSSRFIDGGVTGISMLVSDLTGLPLALFIPLINLPFIAVGYRQIGARFALKSTLAIAGLSACLALLSFPDVTHDKLLTAVFGGFFIGAGIGLAMRGGAVLDGTEVAALLVSKNSSLLRVGDVILLLNVFIFSAAAFFLGVEIALYSVLTYVAASKTVDFLLHGIEQYTAMVIVSEHSEPIRQAIIRDLARGVTLYKGRRGWTDAEQDILFCVVTRLEIGRVRGLVAEYDPAAFVVIYPLSDVHGGVIKKSALH